MKTNINYIKNINLLDYDNLVKGDVGSINFAIAAVMQDNLSDARTVSLIQTILTVSSYAYFD